MLSLRIQNPMNRSAGFSLVELMVAMALSMVLLLGVVSIYTNSKQTYNTQEGLSRLQENARFAMGRLTREIAAAGYLGCLEVNEASAVVNTLQDQAGVFNFNAPITGTNDNGLLGSDTITVARAVAGGSLLVIEPMNKGDSPIKLDKDAQGYGDIEQHDVLVIADCSKAAAFMVTNVPGNDGIIQHVTGVSDGDGQQNTTKDLRHQFGNPTNSRASVLRVGGSRFEIDDSARGNCTAATPGYCALFQNGDELVEGVQNLQIEYGVDTNGDTQVDAYETANAVGDWSEVVAVRLSLTVNEVERVQGANTGVTDPQMARTYTSVIRIRSRGV
jgi:type IV pilus assembly protein PilW